MLEYMSVVRGGLAVQTSGGDRSWKGGVDLSGGGWYPSAHYENLKHFNRKLDRFLS